MTEHLNSRTYLKALLEEKSRLNPKFSLRAFAKLVGLSPAFISRVLRGEKFLSQDTASRISLALSHNHRESLYFRDLVLLDAKLSDRERSEVLERVQSLRGKAPRPLDLDRFKVISDWQHFAILNLINTSNFKSDERWIAKRLGISPMEVKAALQRLADLELIEFDKKRILLTSGPNLSTSDDIASAALRSFHRQMLTKAAAALDSQNVHEREFESLTISFHPKEMKRAKLLIREFVGRANVELEKNPGRVYQLNVQFFRITKPEQRKYCV